MKASSFSKLAFVCALVLGVIVFWAAAAPGKLPGHSVFGAYHPTEPGGCCNGTGDGWCTLAAHPSTPGIPGSLGCTSGQPLIYCEGVSWFTTPRCTLNGEVPCWTNPEDNWYCNNTENMPCT
jgi:hypothetical protein